MNKDALPSSVETEEALLGAILSDGAEVFAKIEGLITADDFYSGTNGVIFEACTDLFNSGSPIDMMTVFEKLKQKQLDEKTGGFDCLLRISNGNYLSSNAETYAEIIAEKATKRKLILASDKIRNVTEEDTKSLNELLDIAEKTVQNISLGRNDKSYSPIAEIIPEVYDDLDNAQGRHGITGLATGFVDLDKRLKGLKNSDLILVGARPGMGKTAFMLDIARYMAVKKNVAVAIFDLEMSKRQLATRLLSAESGVKSEKLASAELSAADWNELAIASATLSKAPIYIDDAIDSSIQSIRAKCRKMKAEYDIKIIIIDYLQLVTSSGRRVANRQEEVQEISRALKSLARELDVPIVVGCQLSRTVESRDDKRPQLSDLRESGTLEQDADIVLFLYRDFYYSKEPQYKNVAEVITGKFRNGAGGTDKLVFDADHISFKNMSVSKQE